MNGNGDLNSKFLGDGSQTSPSEGFFYEQNTGLYHDLDTYPNTAWTMVKKGNKRIRVDDTSTTLYGTVNVPGLVPGGTVSLADGSASAPSLNFITSTNSGLYHSTTGVSISSNGNDIIDFTPGGINTNYGITSGASISGNYYVKPDDTKTAPGFTWYSDQKTGMFHKPGNQIGFALNGTDYLDITPTNLTSVVPILTPDGSSSASAYSFSTSASSGVSYDSVSNALNLNINGNSRLFIDDSGIAVQPVGYGGVQTPHVIINGVEGKGVPGYTWLNDSMTGMWNSSNHHVGIQANAVFAADFSGTLQAFTGTVSATATFQAGTDSKTAPGYTWTGDPHTGIFNKAANTLGITVGGAEAASITQTVTTLTTDLSYPQYYIRVVRTAAQSIPTSAATWVSFDGYQVAGGANGNWTSSFPATGFTIPFQGMYLITYTVPWASSILGMRTAFIEINPSTPGSAGNYWAESDLNAVASTGIVANTGSFMMHLNANDIVALTVSQTSGGNLNMSNQTGGKTLTRLSIFRIANI